MAYKEYPFGKDNPNPHAWLPWVFGLCISVVILLMLVLYSINMKSNATLQNTLKELEAKIDGVDSGLSAKNTDLHKGIKNINENHIAPIESEIKNINEKHIVPIESELPKIKKTIGDNKAEQDKIRDELTTTTKTANAIKGQQEEAKKSYVTKREIEGLVKDVMTKRFGPELDKKKQPVKTYYPQSPQPKN